MYFWITEIQHYLHVRGEHQIYKINLPKMLNFGVEIFFHIWLKRRQLLNFNFLITVTSIA